MLNKPQIKGFIKQALNAGLSIEDSVLLLKGASLQHLDLTAGLKNFNPTKPNFRMPAPVKQPGPIKKPADAKYPDINRDINIATPKEKASPIINSPTINSPTVKAPELNDPPQLNPPAQLKYPTLPPRKEIKAPAPLPYKPIDHSKSKLLQQPGGGQIGGSLQPDS